MRQKMTAVFAAIRVLAPLLIVFFLALEAFAETDTLTPAPTPQEAWEGFLPIASLDVKTSADMLLLGKSLANVEKRIEELDDFSPGEAETRFHVSQDVFEKYVEGLDMLRTTINAITTSLGETERLSSEARKAEEGTNADKMLTTSLPKPPYNLSLSDSYEDRLLEIRKKRDSLKTKMALGDQALVELLEARDEIDKDIRLKREQADKLLPWQKEYLLLNRDLIRAQRILERVRLENLKLEDRFLAAKVKDLQRLLSYIGTNLSFDEKDLSEHLADFQRLLVSLRKDTDELMKKRQQSENTLSTARKAMSTASGDVNVRQAMVRIGQREAELELTRQRLEQNAVTKQLIGAAQQAWRARYDLLRKKPSIDDMKKWQSAAKSLAGDIDNIVDMQQSESLQLQSKIATLQKDLEAPDLPRDMQDALLKTRRAVEDLLDTKRDFIAFLLENATLAGNMYDELTAALGSTSLSQKMQVAWQEQAMALWKKELWVADERPITVGKITSAALLMIFGILFSVLVARWVGHRLEKHFKVLPTSAMAIRRLIFYILLVAAILWALATVGIPLTAFAFMGGALAIGFGLGAQTLFSQMISGFILTIQKPIRIGDRIQIGNAHGKVVTIGSRYTRVRTFDNLSVLVPNEHFLSQQVINWTLSSHLVRGNLRVGVAYDAPPEKVKEILLDVAENHPHVLKNPAAFVRFVDFADSALLFDLFFWVELTQSDPVDAASDMRYAIMERFAEATINIAFPQRDVHLDTQRPLEVHLSRGARRE